MEITIKHKIFTSEGDKTLSINKKVDSGSFVRVSGSSGVGKTTFFKIMAGLIAPDYGYLQTDDKLLLDTSNRVFLTPQKRGVAIMFQNYALFPNMTVRENIVYAQQVKDLAVVDGLLERLDLKMLENVLPTKLSGGQQQRVALARTLVQKADIVLLDEPVSAVDAGMRQVMIAEIFRFHQLSGATFFVISHHEEDFRTVADNILVID